MTFLIFKNRLPQTKNQWMVAREEDGARMGEKSGGVYVSNSVISLHDNMVTRFSGVSKTQNM